MEDLNEVEQMASQHLRDSLFTPPILYLLKKRKSYSLFINACDR